jgi:pyruvate formate lyase activating enzyme
VVLSGGEPCLYTELPQILREIKRTGLPVKLDTNGMFPLLLEKLFSQEESRPDYIALDLKIAPNRYRNLQPPGKGAPDPALLLCQSAELIRQAGINHEDRSLALGEGFFSEKDIEELAPLTDNSPWYFRPLIGGNCLDPSWNNMEMPTAKRVEKQKKKARELGKTGIAKS